MAVRFDAATDRISYTASSPPATFTITAWAYLSVDTNTNAIIARLWDAAAGNVAIWRTAVDGTGGPTYFSSAGTISNTTGFVVGEWRKVAITRTGASAQTLVATPTGSTEVDSGAASTAIPAGITLAARHPDDGAQPWNGRLAHMRIWSAVLSQAEIEAEWASPTPVRTSGLWAAWPLAVHTDLTDTSGNGRHLVAGSTSTTTEAGPPLPAIYDKDGGAVVLGVGSGVAEVVEPAVHDKDGGAAVLAVGSGTADVIEPAVHDRDGGAAVSAIGSGSVSVTPATIHDKGGGAVVQVLADGAKTVTGFTTHDKSGGAVAFCIAAGSKVVIHGGSNSRGAFVTLRHDIKVRVGDTWGSPTWAILLPGGLGVDLADGWTCKASVRRHRVDGGALVHEWVEPDGMILGQAEVTLSTGTTVTTSTVSLRHTGDESADWPVFVGPWDFEIRKGVDDFTIAGGIFRTIREVTA